MPRSYADSLPDTCYVVQLASPGWDAVAKSKAVAAAEEYGQVWDGKFTMVPMPDNPCIRTMASDKLRIVGMGMQGTVTY